MERESVVKGFLYDEIREFFVILRWDEWEFGKMIGGFSKDDEMWV